MDLQTACESPRLDEGAAAAARRSFDSLETCLALIGQLPAGRNVVVSPHSVASLLVMLYCAARGSTREELERILCLSDDAVECCVGAASRLRTFTGNVLFRLSGANAAFVSDDVTVESQYSQLLERLSAKASLVQFAKEPEEAREKINAWVAEETGGHIKNLLQRDAVDCNTALVLANAVYFKGLWMEPFDAERTRDGEFRTASGAVVVTKMMNVSSRFRYLEDEELRLQLLLLPYAGGGEEGGEDELGMLILLPFDGTSVGECLQLRKPVSDALAATVSRMHVTDVDVVLPKFSTTTYVNVRDCLSAIGVRSLFGGEADLSGMCSSRRLAVSSCIHKASVDVAEEGTEASAASLSVIMSRCMVWPEKFTCDRPFAFVIWHKSSASPLFFGRVDDPTLVSQY